jgi:transcription elongation factor GreA
MGPRSPQKKTDALFSQVGEQAEDFDTPVMTRVTWALLQRELEELERELRTTIPQTIQKARELGDLKENAEYHSAKLKQRNAQTRASSLQKRISRARFVEDAEYREGVAGLGTEVVLESAGETTSYWILGDGEHHLGQHVISHQTPIARAILGHTVGDELELGEGEQRRTWRLQSVVRRLPPAGNALQHVLRRRLKRAAQRAPAQSFRGTHTDARDECDAFPEECTRASALVRSSRHTPALVRPHARSRDFLPCTIARGMRIASQARGKKLARARKKSWRHSVRTLWCAHDSHRLSRTHDEMHARQRRRSGSARTHASAEDELRGRRAAMTRV